MTNNNKTMDSKAKFGTLTATADANNEYSASGAPQAPDTNASKAQYGTLTATSDANGEYSASTASGSGNSQYNTQGKQQSSGSKKPGQKPQTTQYDANGKP